MTTEPRDPALAALVSATVRVGSGSGVVIRGPSAPLIATAAHVLKGDEPPMVRRGNIFGEGSVLARNPELDVALVTPPQQLEALALKLADQDDAGRPGDAVWAAGFPSGWDGPDPVLAPGAIAGVGERNWVNFDGTWGNSGGPICRLVGREALIVGVLLGNASRPSQELTSWANDLERIQADLEGRLPEVEEQLRQLEKMHAEVLDLPPIESGDLRSEKLKAKAAKLEAEGEELRTRIKRHQTDLERARQNTALLQWVGVILSSQLRGLRSLSDFIDQHFRTGFLRFAPVADLRKLLG